MKALMLSSLLAESDPAELAGVAIELGFDGIELQLHGRPTADTERTITLLTAAGAPVGLLTSDLSEPSDLATVFELAATVGIDHVRIAPLAAELADPAAATAELGAAASRAGVTCLLPNHPGSCLPDVPSLAAALQAADSDQVAAALAPDYLPRTRAGDHSAWVSRLPLPRIGAVAVAGHRWSSEIGAGNLRVWTPRLALVMHALTPWSSWLQRLRDESYDGLYTFGDASLAATAGEVLRTLRDDLRFVKRTLDPGRNVPER